MSARRPRAPETFEQLVLGFLTDLEPERDHGLIQAAGRDSHEQLWRLTSAGWAGTRSERRSS